MIYGCYGCGKTWFGGSAADVSQMRDVLFVDAEAGTLTINNRPDVDIVTVGAFRELNTIKEYLIRHCSARDKGDLGTLAKMESQLRGEVMVNPKQYRTVVIDSLTEMHRKLMYELTGVDTATTNLDSLIGTPEWADWNQASQRVQLMIRAFRDIPINVIFIASSQEKEDATKQLRIIPNLSGKLAKEVQGFLDCVGFLRSVANDKGEVARRLDLVGTAKFDAKHRFTGAKTNFLSNPTMAKLYALAQGKEIQ
jgi:hypothetical protein